MRKPIESADPTFEPSEGVVDGLHLTVEYYAGLAVLIHQNADSLTERVAALRRLIARIEADSEYRSLPANIPFPILYRTFRRMGRPDYVRDLGTAEAILGFVRGADEGLWDDEGEGLYPAEALLALLPQVLDDEVEHTEDLLRLLGRLPAEVGGAAGAAGAAVPHFCLVRQGLLLDSACRGLVREGLLHPDTREADFRYVCTGQGRPPKGPLVWTGRKNLFRAFVLTLFRGQPDLWSTATRCFRHSTGLFQPHIRNGKPPLEDDQRKLDRALGHQS
ncbi:MAG: hypothetical protein J6I49_06440 [Bacteroidales bacterium]|nr:hypothetical protein [Bacteroidales bacterium]